MGTTNREQNSFLKELLNKPTSFNFFQAVRLLEIFIVDPLEKNFSESPLKLNVYHKNKFPVGAIENFTQNTSEDGQTTFCLQVSFLCLTGMSGALPPHYREKLLIETHGGNSALQDFFDIINNRFLWFYYQAWKKNRFFVGYKIGQLDHRCEKDPFTSILENLSGIPSNQPTKEVLLKQDLFSFYSSLWGREIRSMIALERMLSEYFNLPIQILSYQGQWLFLSEKEFSRIGSFGNIKGQYHQLGFDTVLGHQQWNVQNKFRVYIGPIHYGSFKQLNPSGKFLRALKEMIRIYVLEELNFDIELELLAAEVPPCELNLENPKQLGWNTWIHSQAFKKNVHAVILN